MKTIAVFASHGGSNLQAGIDAVSENRLAARIGVVISNNSTAEALERARRAGITACHISLKSSGSEEEMARKMLEVLAASKADFILLLGYMRMLPLSVLTHYRNRIFNIHPALLPRYGGKGMYGIHVHEAVIAAGEKMSGVTIHRVDESYDRGEIVAQTQVPVLPDDTPERLAARVLVREHTFLIETVQRILSGQIAIGV